MQKCFKPGCKEYARHLIYFDDEPVPSCEKHYEFFTADEDPAYCESLVYRFHDSVDRVYQCIQSNSYDETTPHFLSVDIDQLDIVKADPRFKTVTENDQISPDHVGWLHGGCRLAVILIIEAKCPHCLEGEECEYCGGSGLVKVTMPTGVWYVRHCNSCSMDFGARLMNEEFVWDASISPGKCPFCLSEDTIWEG